MELIARALQEGRNLLEPEAMELLQAYKLPVLPYGLMRLHKEFQPDFLREIEFPVVLKVVSREILHKSDVGGVKVNIKDIQELVQSVQDMEGTIRKKQPQAEIDGWIIYPYLKGGTEMIAGSITDTQFGPSIMIGIGGIFTEALKDISFRLIPISFVDAEDMIGDLKAQAVLTGIRGKGRVDVKNLASLLMNLSRMVSENPEIAECDLNPIICRGNDLYIVDARIKLHSRGTIAHE